MKVALAFLVFLIIFFDIQSQNGTVLNICKISGKIIDAASGTPIEYATVALINASDSTIITGTITNSSGDFTITAYQYGNYNLQFDFISYKRKLIKNILIDEDKLYQNLGIIVMEQQANQLTTVQVSAEKNAVQLGIDKNTYNVSKDLTNTGSTAIDVLRKLPSVTVDMNGKVSLRGSDNVKILINGKPSNITGSGNTLELLSASTIENVEVIKNPSAKYDAEGMAGIINIITRKQKLPGLNGLFNFSTGTNHNVNFSSNLNYGFKNINFFGGYNFGYYRVKGTADIQRKTTINDTIHYLNQKSKFIRKDPVHIINGGFDFIIDSNNSLTFSTLYRIGSGKNDAFNDYIFLNHKQHIMSQYDQQITDISNDNGVDLVLSYEKKINKNDKLTADLLYFSGFENNETVSKSLPSKSNINLQQFFNNEKLNNLSAQIDYSKNLGKGNLEVGWKYNIRNIKTGLTQIDWLATQNVWSESTEQISQFNYYEEINSIYGIYSNTFNNFNYQVGLRAEHTGTKISGINSSEENINFYNNFFPSLHISRAIDDKNILKISYSRRINRPGYWNLNPIIAISDPYNQSKGNPFLKPEKINSYDISYNKYWNSSSLSGSIYYKSIKDVMSSIRKMDGEIAVSTIENLSKGRTYGAEIIATGSIKAIRINGSVNVYHTLINAMDLNPDYDSDYFSYRTHLSAGLKTFKDLEVQVFVNYQGPMSSNQLKINSFFFADVAFKKSFLDQKLDIRIAIKDIFDSFKYEMETTGENIDINGTYKRNSFAGILTISYQLNNYKFKEVKNTDQDFLNNPIF